MRTNELCINVSREYVNQELDNVSVTIPIFTTYGEKGEYAEIRASLVGREWFPNRSSYGSHSIAHETGPRAFRVQFDTHGGATDIVYVEAALKTVRKLVKKNEASLIRPRTFGEAVALWAQVTGLPVRVFRPTKDFGVESLTGEDTHTITEPREAGEFLDRVVNKITKTKREALGLEPKPEVIEA